jgi:hypothetical protein
MRGLGSDIKGEASVVMSVSATSDVDVQDVLPFFVLSAGNVTCTSLEAALMLVGTPLLISIRLLLALDEDDAGSVVAEEIVEELLLVSKDGLRSASKEEFEASFCGTYIAEDARLLAGTSDRTITQSSCLTAAVDNPDIASCDVASILTCQAAAKGADCEKSNEVPEDGFHVFVYPKTTVSDVTGSDRDVERISPFSADD